MAYNPIVAGSEASSSYMNAALAAAVIRVADAAALTATLSHSAPPAVGTWLLQDDIEVLKRRAGTGFTDVIDFRRARALAAPDLDFIDTAGAEQGTLSASVTTARSTFTFSNPAGSAFAQIIQTANGVRVSQRSNNYIDLGSGIDIQSAGDILLDASNANMRLRANHIYFGRSATDPFGPLVTIGQTQVPGQRFLGTNAVGQLTGLGSPVPTWLPATLGDEGQALIAGPTVAGWGNVAASGGGTATPEESFFTPSLPSAVRSAVGETQINIAAGTLSDNHPFSVTSNGIVVAAGTDEFFATLDYVLDINPTHWTSGATAVNRGARAPGNRLFVDIYWKKDGVIMADTRISHYIRGDEDWAPGDHKLHGNFTEILGPGTYTLWINRTVAAGAGNEISGYEILAANSDIHIVTPGAGGGSSGSSSFIGLTDTPSAFIAGQYLRANAGATALEFADAITLGPNSVTAAQAQLDTKEHRQEWHNRLEIPAHDTVGLQDFTIFSGVPTAGGIVGFAATQAEQSTAPPVPPRSGSTTTFIPLRKSLRLRPPART